MFLELSATICINAQIHYNSEQLRLNVPKLPIVASGKFKGSKSLSCDTMRKHITMVHLFSAKISFKYRDQFPPKIRQIIRDRLRNRRAELLFFRRKGRHFTE